LAKTLGPSVRPIPLDPDLLAACNEYCQFLKGRNGVIETDGASHSVEFSILCSDIPGMFNLGGDLGLLLGRQPGAHEQRPRIVNEAIRKLQQLTDGIWHGASGTATERSPRESKTHRVPAERNRSRTR
jgi:hypothetical protein